MTHNILNNWNFSRIIRLGLGIYIMAESIQAEMWMLAGLGLLFSIMSLLNIGCCSTGNCAVPQRKKKSSSGNMTCEEIK